MSIRIGNRWLELIPGQLRVQVRPVSRLMARQAASDMFAAKILAADTGKDEATSALYADEAYNLSLARQAIVDWAGDVEDAEGNPAPVNDETIGAVMALAGPAKAFNELYIEPFLAEVAEKNASSPSSTGNSDRTAQAIADDASNPPGSDSVAPSASS